MSKTDAFFDTNVLLYIPSADIRKAERARALISEGGFISIQVLDEVASVAFRKYRLPWPTIRAFLTTVRRSLDLTRPDISIHELGLDIAERYHTSIYDSMLLAAALQAGCTIFWSEDLHNGQVIEGALTIRNPFA